MKKFMAVLILTATALSAWAADAVLVLGQLSCDPATNRIVEIQRQQPFPGNISSNWSGVSGIVTVSNVGVGDYNVWVRQRGSAGQVAFSFSITTNDTGSVYVHTNNLSVIGVSTYPRVGAAAWSIAASDSRYAFKGEAGGSSTLWTSTGGAIYPSGATGTEAGWTSTTGAIYPQ